MDRLLLLASLGILGVPLEELPTEKEVWSPVTWSPVTWPCIIGRSWMDELLDGWMKVLSFPVSTD